MAASAKLFIGFLCLLCLGLVSSSRVLKESAVYTESAETHSKDGFSSAWVTVAGSGQASASGSTTGAGTGVGIGTGSGSGLGEGIGVGIGVGGDPGLGTGFGTGTGTGVGMGIGVGVGVGGGSGLGAGFGRGTGVGTGIGMGTGSGSGVGIGIGGGGGSGSGTDIVCELPNCNPVRNEPTCNHGTHCNPTYDPPIEVPVWIPGECRDQGIVFEPPVCVSSGCQEVRCNHDKISGSSRTRETGKGKTPVTKTP